jgi:hypothetical protein
MLALLHKLRAHGVILSIAAVHDGVRAMMERGGLIDAIGSENVFWSADQAIVALEQRGCSYCTAESAGSRAYA